MRSDHIGSMIKDSEKLVWNVNVNGNTYVLAGGSMVMAAVDAKIAQKIYTVNQPAIAQSLEPLQLAVE